MSKKILVFVVLFSLTLSLMVTQEASALTKGPGQYSRTTASLDPSRVCGGHICQPGENSKWSHSVSISQRQGPTKATGGYNGIVIMHQLVVNTLAKSASEKSSDTNNAMSEMPSIKVNATSSK